ncbi:NAD(P)/FAD-dependent oxidoreductase [Streptomyces sp. NPDC018960]|uniref:NAD(P)/FAD-dependent oxidoreductase n=1 Tax=unclassified Streptomyces TaxID=2593676 RepID=UPI00378B2B4F
MGLINTIALAKRGLSVVCIDQPTEKQQASYKVGESLLIFSNAFLRTLGELDDSLNQSFQKAGFWMAHGLEGRTEFDDSVSEWGFQSKLPDRWMEKFSTAYFPRVMFQDSQIVRPEIEAELRERARETDGVTFLDRGLVRDIDLGDDSRDHVLHWVSRNKKESGEIAARWMVDCSGRTRLLARKYGHDLPLDEEFRTTAAWAQFSGCGDDLFDERWNYAFPDGDVARRERNTVHLWGDGYWIWIIRLAGDRVSVGVTYHRGRPPEEGNAREVFWKVLRRYPLLDWLKEENVLEFSAYRDVQHCTDTFVSPKRYAMVGDASSIIDAYYSQGISLSMTTSWHIANVAQRDIQEGVLDEAYLNHVNRAATADWRIMRSMVRSKYSPAIADSRFFVLDHLLDLMIFGAAMLGRFRASRWLIETGGRTSEETEEHVRLREGLSRRLFLSQSAPWHRLDPHVVAGAVERWHRGLERRAIRRLEDGVRLPATKAVMRAHAALPGLWRLPFGERPTAVDLTLPAPAKEPEFLQVKGHEYRPVHMAVSGTALLTLASVVTLADMADTQVRRLRGLPGVLRRRRGPR